MPAPVTEPAKGFTLVELVVTIAVLAIALLAVAQSLQFSTRFSADPLWQSKTAALAQAYSDEIAARRFDERSPVGGIPACSGIGASAAQCSPAAAFGPDGSEVRGLMAGTPTNTFDDVDDYHGLDEAPRDALGNPLDEYGGYRVRVTVAYAGSELGRNPEDVKEVTLTLTPPGQQPLTFSLYRGNF